MPYLLLVLTALFWSGNFIIGRGMHAEIPPLALSFWRWSFALLILSFFGVAHLWRQRRLARQHLRFIVIQGILGVTGFNSLIYLAMQTTTAINAVLVNSCIPVLIAVCSWIMYKEVMSVRQVLGVLTSLCGVSLILARGDMMFLLSLDFNRGDVLVLVAALFWALYSANLKRYPAELHPFSYLSGIVIVGLIFLLPLYIIEISLGKAMHLSGSSLAAILYVALFASVLAFIFWNRAVRMVGANKAGPFIYLMPVFSTILAIIFLGEKVYLYHIFGVSLISAGIVMTTFRVSRTKMTSR
ncbi:DMT family transporter [Desulfopila inferna]|uniref:DMT family transporter n=1 Tax=Desulfopila inferna TaxID=468528 RepID=UPI001962EA63|nr:DMT family transporter [Desulfopila inferna]MBM9605586.1 DMT family transporter [Desulfopila inferna]